MAPHNASFAPRLKETRTTLGLTQEEFSKKLGCSRVAYAYYEAGKRIPDVDFLHALRRVTGFPLDYLLGYTVNRTPETLYADQSLGLSDQALEALKGSPVLRAAVLRILESDHAVTFADFLAAFNHVDVCRRQVENADIGMEANRVCKVVAESYFSAVASDLRSIFQASTDTDSFWYPLPTLSSLELDLKDSHVSTDPSSHPSLDERFYWYQALRKREAQPSHGQETRE